MSYTEEQKAYFLRKMRTRTLTLDINKDGHISYEDYEIMGKKVGENSQMTEEQTELSNKKVTEIILASTLAQSKARFDKSHSLIFDAIDTNKSGQISLKEFKEYFRTTAPVFLKLRSHILSILLIQIRME